MIQELLDLGKRERWVITTNSSVEGVFPGLIQRARYGHTVNGSAFNGNNWLSWRIQYKDRRARALSLCSRE
jgi:hypothetical protein